MSVTVTVPISEKMLTTVAHEAVDAAMQTNGLQPISREQMLVVLQTVLEAHPTMRDFAKFCYFA